MIFFEIEPQIETAQTLPAEAYRSQNFYDQLLELVLARSWQFYGNSHDLLEPGKAIPWQFLPGSINEPLIMARSQDHHLHCLSNVCTHRGSLLLEKPTQGRFLRCPYHNRCFELNGHFRSMPGFEDQPHFPSPKDHLPHLPLEDWHGFLFAALEPGLPFSTWIDPVQSRLGWVPWQEFVYSPQHSQDFELEANWMLYVDNYLEGFHIPYVHPGLAQVLDGDNYEVIPLPWGVLQIGFAKDENTPVFDLPSFHPDAGQAVAAYYYWLFPNLMLNLYPWGLSVNQVLPQSLGRTIIRYKTYIWNESLMGQGAGADPSQVEQEDQQIVQRVQKGIQSRLYKRGRYSASHEKGVHHFHRLLAKAVHE
jgi:choline monooxygenase